MTRGGIGCGPGSMPLAALLVALGVLFLTGHRVAADPHTNSSLPLAMEVLPTGIDSIPWTAADFLPSGDELPPGFSVVVTRDEVWPNGSWALGHYRREELPTTKSKSGTEIAVTTVLVTVFALMTTEDAETLYHGLLRSSLFSAAIERVGETLGDEAVLARWQPMSVPNEGIVVVFRDGPIVAMVSWFRWPDSPAEANQEAALAFTSMLAERVRTIVAGTQVHGSRPAAPILVTPRATDCCMGYAR